MVSRCLVLWRGRVIQGSVADVARQIVELENESQRHYAHAISDTSGISVCFGNVQDPVLLERAKLAIEEMRAKWSDRIQIDTTHFICTTPAATPSGAHAAGNSSGAPGVEYQKALQLSIPVVQPQWVLACLQEKKYVPSCRFSLRLILIYNILG